MIAVLLNIGSGVRLIKLAKLCMCTQTLQTQRGRTHGAGCVRQWFRTADPLGERRYENWNTHTVYSRLNLCCLYLLAFPAAVTLFVHVRNKQRKWDSYPDRLKVFMLMGCFVQLAGVCGFVTYITLAITNHQGTVEQHYNGPLCYQL